MKVPFDFEDELEEEEDEDNEDADFEFKSTISPKTKEQYHQVQNDPKIHQEAQE